MDGATSSTISWAVNGLIDGGTSNVLSIVVIRLINGGLVIHLLAVLHLLCSFEY